VKISPNTVRLSATADAASIDPLFHAIGRALSKDSWPYAVSSERRQQVMQLALQSAARGASPQKLNDLFQSAGRALYPTSWPYHVTFEQKRTLMEQIISSFPHPSSPARW
jgi:hypothetical protein